MQYNTIILELLHDNPELKASLLRNSSLISIMVQYATQLRNNHLEIIQQMQTEQPETSELMISSEALEIALAELQNTWSNEVSPVSLDKAMDFVRNHTQSD